LRANNSQCQQTIRVFTSNVRGLVKNWTIIKQLNTSNYDVLLFNEIWQVRDFEILKIPEFNLVHSYQRTNSKGGGAIVFVKSNLKAEKIDSPIIEGIIETASVKIGNNIFTSLYRPPSGNKQRFVEELSSWIENQHNKKIYIGGDFNLNFLGSDKVHYEAIEIRTNLKPNINNITRIASGTCIDNILTDLNGIHKVSNICIADHQGLTSQMKLNDIKREREKYKYREMKEENWRKFSLETAKLTIRGTTIDEKWNNLTSDIKKSVSESFPE